MGPAYYSGGTVHLHQGLLDSLQNTLSEADAARGVAYVLAHELAHHNRGHIATHFAKKSLRRTEVGSTMHTAIDEGTVQGITDGGSHFAPC